MLKLETVKLVELYNHKMSPSDRLNCIYTPEQNIKVSEYWDIFEVEGFYQGETLTQNEEQSLYKILKENKNLKEIATVANYIDWVLSNCEFNFDFRTDLLIGEVMRYWLDGTETDDEYIKSSDWMILAHEQVARSRYIYKMLPIYVEALRMIIRKNHNSQNGDIKQ